MKHTGLLKPAAALLVIALAVSVVAGLGMRKPRARKAPPVSPIPLVEVLALSPGDEPIYVEAFGEVRPARTIELIPEVGGRITSVHPEFIAGGVIGAGATVIGISPEDYELALASRQAAVADAEYELTLELSRQRIARETWDFSTDEAARVNRSMALREPHIKRAEARLDAARKELEAARLDLDRTALKAPFTALVLSTSANEGQLASPSKSVATLIGTDEFHVIVPVPLADLKRLRFPSAGSAGSRARIFFERSGSGGTEIGRVAEVYKLHAELTDGGARAQVILRCRDPLGLKSGVPVNDRILPGAFVRVVIEVGVMRDVYPISREHLRPGDTIWVLAPDDTLEIRPVEIGYSRGADVLVSKGLSPGEWLVTSRLQSPIHGMRLRTQSRAAPSGGDSPAPAGTDSHP